MTDVDYKDLYLKERSKCRELQDELDALKAMVDGNYPKAVYWLQWKVNRQRIALDALQKKGRGHTKEEREAALVSVGE